MPITGWDRVLVVKPSIDEMWEIIEDFGIDRKTIDPRNSMTPEEVEALYFSIVEKSEI